jgi:UDP-N-acetylmuramyl pentapeptide synthase
MSAGADTDVLVVEMAMRGRGQIADLCRIARPTMGLVTNVGVSHIELLGTLDTIAAAKAELVEAIGAAVRGAKDDPAYAALLTRLPDGAQLLFPEDSVPAALADASVPAPADGARWAEAADRTDEAVPAFGFQQAAQEMASAGVEGPVTA